jgi:O-acetylhomoserine/O-acetylserine sulfhydrylase-like pyridoxal-dependent enzyme
MKEHMKNGLAVARYLEKHPFVDKVVQNNIVKQKTGRIK